MNILLNKHQITFLVAVSLLTGCKKAPDSAPGSGVVGTWKLISHQCYCAAAPLPNETVVFTDTTFSFYQDGQRTKYGVYAAGKGQICSSNEIPVTKFMYHPPARTAVDNVIVSLTQNALTLDYGSPCDRGALDTYERLR